MQIGDEIAIILNYALYNILYITSLLIFATYNKLSY